MKQKTTEPIRAAIANPAGRDVRLDILRGLLLVFMMLSHTGSILSSYTFAYLGYVSDAEGFVLLSGYVAGLTYTRSSFRIDKSSLWKKALLRARTIYLYHLGSFGLLYLFIKLFPNLQKYWMSSWDLFLKQSSFTEMFAVITLLYQTTYLDILPMYCIYVLFTPFIILQLKSRRALYILIGSILLWLLAQSGIVEGWIAHRHPAVTIVVDGFNPFAWQLLFVCGLFCGFFRVTKAERAPLSGFLPITYALILSTAFFLKRHDMLPDDLNALLGKNFLAFTDKRTLGPIRLLNTAVVYFVAFSFLRYVRSNLVTRALALLGRHSLQVFTFHLFMAYAIHVIDMAFPGGNGTMRIVLALCGVGSLYLPALFCERRKNALSLSPVPPEASGANC